MRKAAMRVNHCARFMFLSQRTQVISNNACTDTNQLFPPRRHQITLRRGFDEVNRPGEAFGGTCQIAFVHFERRNPSQQVGLPFNSLAVAYLTSPSQATCTRRAHNPLGVSLCD